MSRAAGRVDQPDLLKAELVDGRGQRAVEDELLDEDGRLQQGVLLLRLLGEVLVQVAQEAGVAALRPRTTASVPCLGIISRQNASSHRRIAARTDCPERRLALGKQVLGGRDLADLVEDMLEVLPVGVVRMLAEEEFVRSSASLRRSSSPASQHSSIRSLSSRKRTKTQASTQATAT